jgi:hypothetical protein
MEHVGGARAWLALLFCLAPVLGAAQDPPAPPTNDDCQMCHAEASTTRADGRPVVVDPKGWAASVHGQLGLACVDCHATATEVPHADALPPVDCSGCHADAVAQYAQSVHAKQRAGGGAKLAATCVSCHGVHDILPKSDPESRTHHLKVAGTCATCHGNDATIAQAHLHGGNVGELFEDSIHGRALLKGGLSVAPNCATCHGAHDVRAHADPKSLVARANIPATCGKCHEGVQRTFLRGKHGQMLQSDPTKAPVCIDCHSAHHIQRAEQTAWKVDVINECGTCHAESMATYRDTFHGKVTELGFARVATCADCHGAHEVLPASDPASPVHADNRVQMCRKCHAGANANFAQYDPHADRHDIGDGRLLYYTSKFMEVLLVGVFGFFGLHSGLWFARSLREVRARRTAPRRRNGTPSGGDRDARS